MKKIITFILALSFIFASTGLAWGANGQKQRLNQKVDQQINRQEKKDAITQFRTAYQNLKSLRQQLTQLRNDYKSKRIQFRNAVKQARQNKDTAKLQKAKADLQGIRDLLKDRREDYRFGKQEIQELKEARQNKDFAKAEATVQLMENNLNSRIQLLQQINQKLDQAIADLS